MLELVFPVRCAVCDRRGPSPCPRCVARLRPAAPMVAPPALSSCRALLVYEGAARVLVTALKYRNQRACVSAVARSLCALVSAGPDSPVLDGVTWSPTSAERRRRRGFDQAEVLARAVAAVLGVPCRGLLRRTSGGCQTGRALAARLEGPEFDVTRRVWPSVLLVDDVLTTGATISAAARALRSAGATQVHGLVVAHTPGPTTTTTKGVDDHSR